MPVFEQIRTGLYKELEYGSITLFHEKEKVDDMNFKN
ncbi:mannonate dehydratase [Lacicoccus qingdaonensis]|nr:mannonate dehydratase [Salinicoccus qingdaonensis]